MSKVKKALAIVLTLVVISTVFVYQTSAATTLSAPAGGAYSIGGEFHNGADVRSACDYFALCGYTSYYHDNPTYSYVNSNRLNAYVLYFSAHGNQDAIYLPNDVIVSDGYITETSKTVNIQDYTLNRPKLYIYDACLTASNEDGSGINLCTETRDAGADCVIGWKKSIGSGDAFAWQKRFQNQLALGATVQNAANYADGFSYNDNTSIKSWRIYGNKNIVVKVSKSATIADGYVENEAFRYVDCTADNYTTTKTKASKDIFDGIIAEKFSNFSRSNYKVTYTYTNDEETDYVVDYTYMIGDYSTKIGYSIIVNDNKVIGIQENNMTTAKENASLVKSIPVVSEACKNKAYSEAAREVSQRNDNSVIVEQNGEPFFNAETSTFCYRLKTVYQTESGGYGAFFTFSEI